MPNTTETALGFEAIDKSPADGEDTDWITSEKYESTTPEHWQSLPVSYYQRRGNNKLLVDKDDIPEGSLFRRLLSPEQEAVLKDSDPSTIAPIDIHLRSDGLFLWSPETSRGISIPVTSIATYAPTSLAVQAGTAALSVLRLDLIPDGDGMMESSGSDGGFAPSLLVHIALAADSGGGASANDGEPSSATTDPRVAQSHAEEAAMPADAVAASVAAATQALISALTRCQDSFPDAEQADSEDDDGGLGRRVRFPAIHAGSMVLDGSGDDAGDNGGGGEFLQQMQQQGDDVVRVAGLGNFSGWVTSENVDEVMRTHGIVLNGGEETNGDAEEEEELGPGAGSRRRRDDGEEDGERVTIWQRT